MARGRTNDREGLGWQCGARWTDNNGGWTGGRTDEQVRQGGHVEDGSGLPGHQRCTQDASYKHL